MGSPGFDAHNKIHQHYPPLAGWLAERKNSRQPIIAIPRFLTHRTGARRERNGRGRDLDKDHRSLHMEHRPFFAK